MMYDMSVVHQLYPSLSIYDDTQTYVRHNSLIVTCADVGMVIFVHYFSTKNTKNSFPRSWGGLSRSQNNIIL